MMSVRPTWGVTVSGVNGLWEHGTFDLLAGGNQPGGRVEAEIGYGLPAFGTAGVLTPYAGASLTDAGGGASARAFPPFSRRPAAAGAARPFAAHHQIAVPLLPQPLEILLRRRSAVHHDQRSRRHFQPLQCPLQDFSFNDIAGHHFRTAHEPAAVHHDLEAVFRSLKSELGLRPIFHQKEHRSKGHLFITVLAYQLVQVIRRRLGEQGEHSSWPTLRSILAGQQRVTATFRCADGRTLHVAAMTGAIMRVSAR